MFKRSLLVAVALLLAIAYVGIATPPTHTKAFDATETPTPMPQGPTAIPPAVIGGGAMKISLWDGLTGSDGSTFQAMLAEYVKANPDVSITDEEIGWGSLYPKLTSAFVAGTPPDMFVLHAAEIPQFASQGTLLATDDMFDDKGGPLPAKDFADPAFSMTVYNGSRYGVLLDNHGYGTWVNNALLKKAGCRPSRFVPPFSTRYLSPY